MNKSFDASMVEVQERLSYHLEGVKKMFKADAGTKLTLVVHNTKIPNSNLIIGDDDFEDAIGVIREELARNNHL